MSRRDDNYSEAGAGLGEVVGKILGAAVAAAFAAFGVHKGREARTRSYAMDAALKENNKKDDEFIP